MADRSHLVENRFEVNFAVYMECIRVPKKHVEELLAFSWKNGCFATSLATDKIL